MSDITNNERRLSRLEGKMDVMLSLTMALLGALIAQAAGIIR